MRNCGLKATTFALSDPSNFTSVRSLPRGRLGAVWGRNEPTLIQDMPWKRRNQNCIQQLCPFSDSESLSPPQVSGPTLSQQRGRRGGESCSRLPGCAGGPPLRLRTKPAHKTAAARRCAGAPAAAAACSRQEFQPFFYLLYRKGFFFLRSIVQIWCGAEEILRTRFGHRFGRARPGVRGQSNIFDQLYKKKQNRSAVARGCLGSLPRCQQSCVEFSRPHPSHHIPCDSTRIQFGASKLSNIAYVMLL